MPKVDFLLGNKGHHVAMMAPVARQLDLLPDFEYRVLSICEFYGWDSPKERFKEALDFVCVPSMKFRSSPSVGRQYKNKGVNLFRKFARMALWETLLRGPIEDFLHSSTDLMVIPNDAAFPFNFIVRLLKEHNIPYLLLQEGIRFKLPIEDEEDKYGASGARAIACWGNSSAIFFEKQGAAKETIFLTGSPRFDAIASTDYSDSVERLLGRYHFGKKNLLLLSNPIDDQGFCTTSEKLNLIRSFVVEAESLFQDPEFHLIIKLHGRESVSDFERELGNLTFYQHRISLLGDESLYPLFTVSQAAVVLGSTVGLEALLFDLPLGVIEIPGWGHVHDYVQVGVAIGLSLDTKISQEIKKLFLQRESESRREAVEIYLSESLVVRENATGNVVNLVRQILSSPYKK